VGHGGGVLQKNVVEKPERKARRYKLKRVARPEEKHTDGVQVKRRVTVKCIQAPLSTAYRSVRRGFGTHTDAQKILPFPAYGRTAEAGRKRYLFCPKKRHIRHAFRQTYKKYD